MFVLQAYNLSRNITNIFLKFFRWYKFDTGMIFSMYKICFNILFKCKLVLQDFFM